MVSIIACLGSLRVPCRSLSVLTKPSTSSWLALTSPCVAMCFYLTSFDRVLSGSLQSYSGGKNIRTGESAPVRSGDRRPERRTPVVPQRRCPRLVVYLPVQRSLPPTRGATACPNIVAHITKPGPRSRCERILASYRSEERFSR